MTAEEAIKWFEVFQDNLVMRADPTEKTANALKASKMAIEALEKQTPRKPALSGDGYADGEIVYDIWECPNCGAEYEIDCDGKHKFCPNCGQAIDWSEE